MYFNRIKQVPTHGLLLHAIEAVGWDLLVSGVVQATPDKLRSSYSVNEQVAKRIANIRFDPNQVTKREKENMFQILIVEDDKELSQLFQKVLEKNGYQVKSASDGAQALEILDKEYIFQKWQNT